MRLIQKLLALLLVSAVFPVQQVFAAPDTKATSTATTPSPNTASAASSSPAQPTSSAQGNSPEITPSDPANSVEQVTEASATDAMVLQLTERIRFFIEDMATSWPGELVLNITPPDISRQTECHDFELFLSGRQGLSSRMNVGIRCIAPQTWVSYTAVNVKLQGVYYVTSRNVGAGTVLSLDDVIPVEGDLLRIPPGSVLDPGQVVGYISTQRLAARRPIRASSLRSPDSVERGQRVRIEVRGAGFVASSDGFAMQNGEPGTQIQVRTLSGQLVTATVLNAQTVLIPM